MHDSDITDFAATGRVATLDVLGVPIAAINLSRLVGLFARWILDRGPRYVCVRDVHGVVRCQDDPELLEIHRRAALNTPDGMPLVWLLRAHGHHDAARVYGPDILEAVLAAPQLSTARHYFYGGMNGSTPRMLESLSQRYPRMQVAGWREPSIQAVGARESAEMLATINAANADVLWVGLGTPKQEYWMARHRAALTAPILIGVGAAFDFHSGRMRQAPRWIQRSGMEWLYRVGSDPRRLAGRYARVVPRFIALLMAERVRALKLSLTR